MQTSLLVLLCASSAISAALIPAAEVHIGPHLPNPAGGHFKDEKIVGGIIPSEGVNNYLIRIAVRSIPGFPASFRCGGSLIRDNWVLTAAHCVNSVFDAPSVLVTCGEHNIDTDTGHEQQLEASEVYFHAGFDDTLQNDIALIKTNGTFDLGEWCRTIDLPQPFEETQDDTNCTVSGWGSTFAGGISARTVHEVTVPAVNDEDCDRLYGEYNVYPSMLCAGVVGVGGKDACQGDSGGPLTCSEDRSVIHGIVSWGMGCALPDYPGVYTQVSHHLDWINERILDAGQHQSRDY